MLNTGFSSPLEPADLVTLRDRVARAKGAVLTATTLAGSGHPGGSFSSAEIFALLWGCARIDPASPRWEGRDRIVVSHGHTSPGVYTALAEAGFFPAEEVEAHFRQAGSVFEGHVERSVPGVEWSTGNLGQGLSAGVGFALGARMTGGSWRTFVAMSDGEQHKGQVAEARRLAVKEGLSTLTAVVDWNHVQISGHTDDVMPVDIVADWKADGWAVHECDGHDLAALHDAVALALAEDGPAVAVAHTVIGHGVSFMEDDPEYHGRGLTRDEYARAMAELGCDPAALEAAEAHRSRPCVVAPLDHRTPVYEIDPGTRRVYEGASSDARGAWGTALTDLAAAEQPAIFAVLDCDLASSVKTAGFAKAHPGRFVQCGVGEHNAATVTGALSTVPGVLAFWADFGAFGIDEVYNQQRLNDINGAAPKVVLTHCGLDVGEDGKTHQCLDYAGVLRNAFGWRVIVPADPNQTDAAVRAMASMDGCVAIAMGRSKLPAILDPRGDALFGPGYRYVYGDVVWAREGADACVLTMGTLAGSAVEASDVVRGEGIDVAVGIVAAPLDLDDEALRRATSVPVVLTVEDHNVSTGLGASVARWIAGNGAGARLVCAGVEAYQSSGPAADLYARAGLDAAGIAGRIRDAIGSARR